MFSERDRNPESAEVERDGQEHSKPPEGESGPRLPGRTFHFTPDGRRIVVRAEDARLEVVRVDEGEEPRPLRLPVPVGDLAVFDDEVWVVSDGPRLSRYTLAGEPVGELAIPSSGPGRLVASPSSLRTALWLGQPAVELRAELGGLSVGEIVGDYDFLLALGTRRWPIARNDGIGGAGVGARRTGTTWRRC